LTDVQRRQETGFSVANQPRSGSFRTYWTLADVVAQGADMQHSDEDLALAELDTVLGEALRIQVRADVPVGAFLSGGIDSSLIVALMREHVGIKPTTFTIGFSEAAYDESRYAKAVAEHLETDHHELHVTPQDVIDLIPNLPHLYTEPFADSSQIPTYLVSQLARQSVTVALSGDAGDEMFGGYNRYKWTQGIWPKLSLAPFFARKFAGRALTYPSQAFWETLSSVPGPLKVPSLGDKVRKISKILMKARDAESLYLTLLDEWDGDFSEMADSLLGLMPSHLQLGDVEKMMLWDALTYLPDDILCKVDRAAMGVSLETRVPFLDHNVIAMAMRLPPTMRIRRGETKWALRQLLYKHVPKHLIERPKAGFGIPLGPWLAGPLRGWAEALLDERALASDGMLDGRLIRQRWNEHVSGERDWTSSLWGVLMLQAFKA
jgi:asparagine synthase (glutamine-hydrolysing)